MPSIVNRNHNQRMAEAAMSSTSGPSAAPDQSMLGKLVRRRPGGDDLRQAVTAPRRRMIGAVTALATAALLGAISTRSVAAQSILDPATESAASLAHLYRIMFVLGLIVFLLIEGLILYSAWRFRRKEGDAEPEQVHGNVRAEVAWTIAPAIVVLVLAAVSFRPMVEAYQVPDEAYTIEVTGKQWFWEFHYPEADVMTANEVVVPVGQPVEFLVDSADVIHSFWVPQLGGKIDAIPGDRDGGYNQNRLWFTVERAGSYEGHCAELCGTQHAGMRFTVTALQPAEFEAWLAAQAEPAIEPQPGSIEARGQEIVSGKSLCHTCHIIRGVDGMVGRAGPDLTHVGSRKLLAGEVVPNEPESLARWIDHPDSVKPGSKMVDTDLTDDQIQAIVAYLQSLE